MQMESLAVSQVSIPAGSMNVCASKVTMSGTLRLKQTSALTDGVQGGIRNIYNDNIFDQLEYQSADSLLKEYVTTRNETTKYDYTHWVQYAANNDRLTNYIEFDMIVRIPYAQDVIFVPALEYVLKFAWVQYFCAFIFWFFVLYKGLLNFVVTSRVFECVEVTDLNTDNIKPLQ